MIIPATQACLDWLDRNHISTHYRGERRWQPGDLISFDDELAIEPYVGIYAGHGICRIGYMSYTNSPVPLDISIGRYCSLAPGIRFLGARHPLGYVSTSVFTHAPEMDIVARFIRDSGEPYDNFLANPQRPPVRIGHDVWIGTGATLLNGVTLGTGSVVAAYSVVTKPVAPYAIVGGNPARVIRSRFADDIADALLRLEWWNYKFTDFKGLAIGNPDRFIAQFSTVKASLEPYEPAKIRLIEMAEQIDRI